MSALVKAVYVHPGNLFVWEDGEPDGCAQVPGKAWQRMFGIDLSQTSQDQPLPDDWAKGLTWIDFERGVDLAPYEIVNGQVWGHSRPTKACRTHVFSKTPHGIKALEEWAEELEAERAPPMPGPGSKQRA